MIVQPFSYPLENSLISKLDIAIKRCTTKNPKRDAVILCEGAEGEGKTTLSIAIAYYVASKTGRNFNESNVYFDVSKMIDFLKNTEDEIIVWDEPALQAMNKDFASKVVKDLERLLMMARKKRHFIIINIAYFNKFNEYIVWQRPLFMLHVYSRNEVEAGRFVYIGKKKLEPLWHDWRFKRKRSYKKFCSKSVRGTFPDVLNPDYKNNVLSKFDVEVYEKNKDEAIQMIGRTDVGVTGYNKDYEKFKERVAKLTEEEALKIVERATYYKWKRAMRIRQNVNDVSESTGLQ